MAVNGQQPATVADSDLPQKARVRDPAAEHLVTLVKRVKQQDRQAFADLYQLTSHKLFGVLLRLVPDRAMAEELLQEAYVKIWQKADHFDPVKAAVITWMVSITRNLAIDELRKRSLPSAHGENVEDEAEDQQADLPRGLAISRSMGKLQGCLKNLDPTHAKMIREAYLNGASRQELAERFAHPVSTVKTWLRRSLAQLKLCLGADEGLI